MCGSLQPGRKNIVGIECREAMRRVRLERRVEILRISIDVEALHDWQHFRLPVALGQLIAEPPQHIETHLPQADNERRA